MISTETEPIIVTEKRVRKSIHRLSEVYDKDYEASKERKSVVVEGCGVKIGDIERVKDAYQRNKIDKEIAKNIHMLCYKALGQANKRNSDIKKFNGFNKEDDNEYKKRITMSEKIKMENLKLICDLFNIPTTGKQKKEISTMLVDFLKCPIETGSKLFRTAALRPKNKKKSSKNKKKDSKKKDKVAEDAEMKDSEIGSMSDSLSEIDNKSDTKEVTKVVSPKLKLKQKETKKKNNGVNDSSKKGTSKAKRNKKSKNDISDGEMEIKDINVDGSEDVKKRNESIKEDTTEDNADGVSDTNMTAEEDKDCEIAKEDEEDYQSKYDLSDTNFMSKIAEILKDADLNSTTLNQVCDQVTAQFPDVDLAAQRHHIKQLVKKVNCTLNTDRS